MTSTTAFLFSVRRTGKNGSYRFAGPRVGAFASFLEFAIKTGITSVEVIAFQDAREVKLKKNGWRPIVKMARMAGVAVQV